MSGLPSPWPPASPPTGAPPLAPPPPAAPSPPARRTGLRGLATAPGLAGSRSDAGTAVRLLGLLTLGGVAAGLLWAWCAPRADFRVVSAAGEVEPVGGLVSPELPVSDDAVYVLVLAGLGLVAGVLAWLPRARRGVVVLLALGAGMLVASVVAWQLGVLLGRGPSEAELQTVGTVVTTALRLDALAALAVGPFVAVFGYLVATVLSTQDDLGRDAT